LSRLLTHLRRINTSWAGGTPSGMDSRGVTDLFVSPEILQEIRAFAYNPMNTRVGPTVPGSTLASYTATTALSLPESVREAIFRAAGTSEIFGVSIHELLELGVAKKYNTLFDQLAGSTQYGGATFDDANDEILVGFDLSRESFLRPVERKAEGGGQFVTVPDDQWVRRSEKSGLYGYLEEGRICIDARGVCGIVV
jgi:hypothetical protein